jgi:hypothetical protein
LIAVTDSPFPLLDPAKAALARIDQELRVAKSPSANDILAVARDADAILVTYAKLSGDLLRQLTRCKAIGHFGLGSTTSIFRPRSSLAQLTVSNFLTIRRVASANSVEFDPGPDMRGPLLLRCTALNPLKDLLYLRPRSLALG